MLVLNDINLKIILSGYGATHYRITTGDINQAQWNLLDEDYIIHFSLPNKEGIYVVSYQLKNPYNVSQVLTEEIQYQELIIISKKPTNLVASSITEYGFTLNWNSPEDQSLVVSYEIYANGISIGNSTSNQFIATNLLKSTTYQISVKTVDQNGTKDNESDPISIRTADEKVISTNLINNITIAQVYAPSSTIVNIQDGIVIDCSFLSLYNNSDEDIDLKNARIYWKYDAYPTWHKVILSGIIKSKKHFLIRGSRLTGTLPGVNILVDWTKVVPDLNCTVDWSQFVDPNPEDTAGAETRMVEWASNNNLLFIASKTGVVYLSNDDIDISQLPSNPWINKSSLSGYVDLVGVLGSDGINDIGETSPINGVKKSLIFNRKKVNNLYQDTDNNSVDFESVNSILSNTTDVDALIKNSSV